MVQRVVVHVGCPKTGTTGLQHRLFVNQVGLADQGYFYPAERPDQHFLAAVDVLEIPWGGQVSADAVDAWDSLAASVVASGQHAIVSHELLARATPAQIRRITSSFGEAEVAVVITARDLGRLIPAEYQEHLKYGNTFAYATFLERLRTPDVDDVAGELAALTWDVQDVPAIAERWAEAVGAERIAIATVPHAGAPRDELVERFAAVAGFDVAALEPPDEIEERENRSFGAVEVGWLRRFNELNTMVDPQYGDFIRDRLVARFATSEVPSAPLVLPPAHHPWVSARSREWVAALARAGYRVAGDLAELLPGEPTGEFVDPDAAPEAELFEVGARVLMASLDDYEELRAAQVPPPPPPPSRVERMKSGIVRGAERTALGQRALEVWRERH